MKALKIAVTLLFLTGVAKATTYTTNSTGATNIYVYGTTGDTTLTVPDIAVTYGATAATLTVSGAVVGNEALYIGPANHKSTCAATTGNWTIHDAMTIGGAVGITGALTGAAATFSGNVIAGAENYKSTFTASDGSLALTGGLVTQGNISAMTGNISSDFYPAGDIYAGIANLKSTFTYTDGNWKITGTVTAPTFIGALTGGAISGTTGTFSGDVNRGAANYVSTFTATTGAEVMTGAFESKSTVTGATLLSGGALKLTKAAKATIIAKDPDNTYQELWGCSNCTTTTVCVSTGTAVADWSAIEDPSAACD